VTFTATVTSPAGVAFGSVTFKDGSVAMATATLNGSGVATLSTNALAAGAHSITAVYAGNADFKSSGSNAVAQAVNKASTTTKVSPSINPSAYHQSVKLTATVAGAFGGQPAGTVTFKSGVNVLGTGTLNASGQATLTVNTIPVGTHSITATYGGNADYVGSASTAFTQTVNKAATKTAIASSLNPSKHGTAVTFTATVSPNFGGAVTGTVTFKNGSTTLGTATVNSSNQAKFTTSTLSVGTHSITAAYSGNGNLTASTSSALSQVVN
jgi:hypothetical protein